MAMKKIDPPTFDRIVSAKKTTIIWTLPAIARRIGVGVDFVRDTLVKVPGSPVRKLGNRWYAVEDELLVFMKTGCAHPPIPTDSHGFPR
jgi:hypothetical protein